MPFPYKWTYRPWANIMHLWYSFIYGMHNLFRYFPVIWKDRNWDNEYLTDLLEFKLRSMAADFDRFGNHVGSEQDATKMRICAALCRRIREHKYGRELPGGDYGRHYFENDAQFVRAYNGGRKRDMEYLGKLLGKHCLSWWN